VEASGYQLQRLLEPPAPAAAAPPEI
jgi:hypothetical protein